MKLVFIPPHKPFISNWLMRLPCAVSGVTIVAPQDMTTTLNELVDADAAFGTLTPELLKACQKLNWLQAPAAGPPAGYFFQELIAHPVVVTNFRGIYNDYLSHHIIALMLALSRQFPRYQDHQRESRWISAQKHIFLPDSTALIVGLGGIGTETARLCKALGMKTIGVDAQRVDQPPWVDELYLSTDIDSVMGRGDFVIVTIPHTPQTEGFFSKEKFSLMKPTAIFINVGRGKTTNLRDLASALFHEKLGGAGLDVFEVEPLPAHHPIWKTPNTIITPHVAGAADNHLDERRYSIVRENLERFVAGKTLHNLVDKSRWF